MLKMYKNVVILMSLLPVLTGLPVLPEPDPAPVQPLVTTTAPPTTIPAYPEQSDVSGCPLELPEELFPAVDRACGGSKNRRLSRSRCCPVLATWLYSAYAGTALRRAGRMPAATPYDLPVLPDDSETCVDKVEKALRLRGIDLIRPNDTCDTVYCYCGIRLHVPSCSDSFVVADGGKLVADARVHRLERRCLSGPALRGCTDCLISLHQLSSGKSGINGSEPERKKKMHDRDCELMGLTWLLAKNRTAYAPTVSAVLRAIMLGGGTSAGASSSEPRTCSSVSQDGMPLAVDSAELDNPSSSSPTVLQFTLHLHLSLLLVSLHFTCSSSFFHL